MPPRVTFAPGMKSFIRLKQRSSVDFPHPEGPMKAVIYRQDRTTDARVIASGIRDDFIKFKGRVSVLDTVVPHAKAYKEAATLRIPVHRHERKREGVTPSASTVMHQLAWELIPSLQGVLAGSMYTRQRIA